MGSRTQSMLYLTSAVDIGNRTGQAVTNHEGVIPRCSSRRRSHRTHSRSTEAGSVSDTAEIWMRRTCLNRDGDISTGRTMESWSTR